MPATTAPTTTTPTPSRTTSGCRSDELRSGAAAATRRPPPRRPEVEPRAGDRRAGAGAIGATGGGATGGGSAGGVAAGGLVPLSASFSMPLLRILGVLAPRVQLDDVVVEQQRLLVLARQAERLRGVEQDGRILFELEGLLVLDCGVVVLADREVRRRLLIVGLRVVRAMAVADAEQQKDCRNPGNPPRPRGSTDASTRASPVRGRPQLYLKTAGLESGQPVRRSTLGARSVGVLLQHTPAAAPSSGARGALRGGRRAVVGGHVPLGRLALLGLAGSAPPCGPGRAWEPGSGWRPSCGPARAPGRRST